MNHCVITACIKKRLLSQPIQQFFTIGRFKDFLERVVFARLPDALGDSQKVQIVIAQDYRCPVSKASNKTQAFKGVFAAVNKVADKPKAICSGIKF